MAATDDSRRPDWRSWLVLAWALWWGWAYASMVVEARAPLVMSWFRGIGK
jgi:hypothetical protein